MVDIISGMGLAPKAVPASKRGSSCYYDGERRAHCVPRGEHIVFMGDSLTRYQWLALATSFARGSQLSESEFPSSVIEREWLHWMPFFQGSNDRLLPNGRCDCHRTYANPVGSKTVENRYYWTPNGALNLSFINVLDLQMPVVGSWAPWEPLSRDTERNALHPNFAPKWSLSWIDTIERVVRAMQPPPTVLILNTGMWQELPNDTYAAALRAAAERAAPRVVWKTTTRMRKAGATRWMRTDLRARRAFAEIYDSAYFTRTAKHADYWDARHFKPRVYNHLNAALIRQLYGAPVSCVTFNHGACSTKGGPRAKRPQATDPVDLAENSPSADVGWAGVSKTPVVGWSVLHTLLWLDSLGIPYNAAAVLHAVYNGSRLVSSAREDSLKSVVAAGVVKSAQRAALLSRLRSVLRSA